MHLAPCADTCIIFAVATVDGKGGSTRRVLVVDDDSSTLTLLEAILRSRGIEGVIASSPLEAQAIIKRETTQDIDCALVDYRMPGMNGLELVQWLFEQDPTLSTVLMTAEGDMDLVTGALRQGVTDYVEKPFRRPELFDSLEKAAERTSERRYLRTAAEEVRDITLIHERLVPGDEVLAPPFAAKWKPRLQSVFMPAHEAGGDFLNCFTLPDNRLLMVIGDVSGHDLKAGFIASYFQGICRGMIAMKATVEEVRSYFNEFLCNQWNDARSKNRNEIITSLAVCFLLIDFDRMTLSCLNNGFPNPCMCPVDLDCAELGEQGPPLGWFQRTETNLVEYPLPEAGSITLWSDGVLERANERRQHVHALGHRLLLKRPQDRATILAEQRDDVLVVRLSWDYGGEETDSPALIFADEYPGDASGRIDQFQEEWKQALELAEPKLDEAKVHEILLCCREAMLNAMLHGSEGAPSGRCKMVMAKIGDVLRIRVDDEGEGYDDLPETSFTPGGHTSLGLRIINAYSDTMWTTRNGAALTMEFSMALQERD